MMLGMKGTLPSGWRPRDLTLAIIGKMGTAGGTGHVIEYAGSAIRGLSMEGRMTVCNMSIEAAAPPRLTEPHENSLAELTGPPTAPQRAALHQANAHSKKAASLRPAPHRQHRTHES